MTLDISNPLKVVPGFTNPTSARNFRLSHESKSSPKRRSRKPRLSSLVTASGPLCFSQGRGRFVNKGIRKSRLAVFGGEPWVPLRDQPVISTSKTLRDGSLCLIVCLSPVFVGTLGLARRAGPGDKSFYARAVSRNKWRRGGEKKVRGSAAWCLLSVTFGPRGPGPGPIRNFLRRKSRFGPAILSSGSTWALLLADFSLEVSGPTSSGHCS